MFSARNLLKNSFLLSLCKYTFLLIILNQSPKLNWSSSCTLLFDNVQTYKYENLYAVRQGGDIPIDCCGYGGNKEDICQKNISI